MKECATISDADKRVIFQNTGDRLKMHPSIMQVGLSLKSHDPSQRANGFLTLAGGIVITFTKEILDIIVG